jgi:hypothetical protein
MGTAKAIALARCAVDSNHHRGRRWPTARSNRRWTSTNAVIDTPWATTTAQIHCGLACPRAPKPPRMVARWV